MLALWISLTEVICRSWYAITILRIVWRLALPQKRLRHIRRGGCFERTQASRHTEEGGQQARPPFFNAGEVPQHYAADLKRWSSPYSSSIRRCRCSYSRCSASVMPPKIFRPRVSSCFFDELIDLAPQLCRIAVHKRTPTGGCKRRRDYLYRVVGSGSIP